MRRNVDRTGDAEHGLVELKHAGIATPDSAGDPKLSIVAVLEILDWAAVRKHVVDPSRPLVAPLEELPLLS